jgi:hypothetical protein
MEMLYIEQVIATFQYPPLPVYPLARRAMPVATAVVVYFGSSAIVALLPVFPKGRCPAFY